MTKTAILVDGGFYRKITKDFKRGLTPEQSAKDLFTYCMKHLQDKSGKDDELYRIFYYDCPPLGKKLTHPLTKKLVDLSKTPLYRWNTDFLDEMKKQRKVALRVGFLSESKSNYVLTQDAMKQLFNGSLKFEDLQEHHFVPDMKQKGVDMKIGVDIASLAFKKQVDRIVLIAGDSDFVPASKLARREGIDFILDPMWRHINPELHEHIDGLRTKYPKPDNHK